MFNQKCQQEEIAPFYTKLFFKKNPELSKKFFNILYYSAVLLLVEKKEKQKAYVERTNKHSLSGQMIDDARCMGNFFVS